MFEKVVGAGWGSVSLATPPLAHDLGGEVSGSVTVNAKRDVGPGNLSVSVVCMRKDIRTIPPVFNRRITRQSHSTEVWRESVELDAGLLVPAGTEISHPFSIGLPHRQEKPGDEGIPEWARGTIAVFNTVTFSRTQLQWQVRAKFHHPDGFDLRHHVSILVNP